MAKKSKKKTSFWRSKEAKRTYWVFGIPSILLLGWYAYTVTFEFNKPAMSRMEANLKAGIADLADRAMREGFKTEDVMDCRNMFDEYTTPKGWFYSDAEMFQLVGLSKEATVEQMNERCVFFAKVVAEMQQMSLHDRHVFVCGDSIFDVGNRGKFYLKADPQGRGALRKLDLNRGEELVHIPKGQTAVLQNCSSTTWGDGCLILGLSKTGVFRMSGHVDYEK